MFRLNPRYHFFICYLILLLLFACRNNPQQPPAEIIQIIHETKMQFCPDRRLAVFDVAPAFEGQALVIRGEVDNPAAKKVLFEKLAQSAIQPPVEIKIAVLPDSAVGDNKWGLVRVSVGNVRAKPGYSAELVNQVMMGSFIEILKKKKGWYYARVSDGYLGWLNSTFFEKMTTAEKHDWQSGQHLVYHKLAGKIYEKPNMGSMIKSDVVGGNILKVVSNGPRWSVVKWASGQTGYVKTADCIPLDQWLHPGLADVGEVIKTALQFKGLPYLWGGNSPKGVDCSGFTQSVFKWNGIDLLRDASQQIRQGMEVSAGEHFENLQRGDLLFFGPRENKITHVGIYLGKKKYIHSSGHVKINSFDSTAGDFSKYRLGQFRSARRIIN